MKFIACLGIKNGSLRGRYVGAQEARGAAAAGNVAGQATAFLPTAIHPQDPTKKQLLPS